MKANGLSVKLTPYPAGTSCAGLAHFYVTLDGISAGSTTLSSILTPDQLRDLARELDFVADQCDQITQASAAEMCSIGCAPDRIDIPKFLHRNEVTA